MTRYVVLFSTLLHPILPASSGSTIFPRINVRDLYKRLGISKEASKDEIQAARNFLVQKYVGHKPSLDAIESAHDKIIMQKFYERRNSKIDVKKKVREVTQSRAVQAVMSRAGAFILSWLLGTFLMVSIIPPLFKGLRGFEVTTSLITYILLWVSSTYLK
ncbi:uncharacterized protein LOC115662606 isoform X2 [Syzygium oleosum]|uniref:uncharacterized protein LOC115662606 isoform X2 n=1 Tax=Syzygium oleosum TaxID=219896 RepID=UPI0024BADB4A|nr:uncharacterized protein LOC115662606 isoform X2 [Syzygium oleosum]